MIKCKGNAAYGPLVYMHFDGSANQQIDLEVLPAPHAVGNHVFAAIKGRGHQIKIKPADNSVPIDAVLRPIVVGYTARFEFLTTSYPEVPAGYEANYEKYFGDKGYRAENITVTNTTEYPVILGNLSENNTIESFGEINDLGKNNRTTLINR